MQILTGSSGRGPVIVPFLLARGVAHLEQEALAFEWRLIIVIRCDSKANCFLLSNAQIRKHRCQFDNKKLSEIVIAVSLGSLRRCFCSSCKFVSCKQDLLLSD